VNLDDCTLLLGEPRSGTTWVGKIIDSHPDVVYRHEPDLTRHEPVLPFVIDDQDTARYIEPMRKHFTDLLTTPTLKSVGQQPLFPKSYYPPGIRTLRTGLTAALMGLRSAANWRALNDLYIPDLMWPSGRPHLRFVLKSIAAAGRVAVLRQAFPNAKIILLLRHPCGHVRSVMEGRRRSMFEPDDMVKSIATMPNAKRYGLTTCSLRSASDLELVTWRWALRTERTLNVLTRSDNCYVVHYEAICENPLVETVALFEFIGLNLHPQTERFIRDSTGYKGNERYYRVFRDTNATVNRWRNELSDDEKAAIVSIVAQTSLAPMWPETRQMASEMVSQ
jgi:hypothetical protein